MFRLHSLCATVQCACSMECRTTEAQKGCVGVCVRHNRSIRTAATTTNHHLFYHIFDAASNMYLCNCRCFSMANAMHMPNVTNAKHDRLNSAELQHYRCALEPMQTTDNNNDTQQWQTVLNTHYILFGLLMPKSVRRTVPYSR